MSPITWALVLALLLVLGLISEAQYTPNKKNKPSSFDLGFITDKLALGAAIGPGSRSYASAPNPDLYAISLFNENKTPAFGDKEQGITAMNKFNTQHVMLANESDQTGAVFDEEYQRREMLPSINSSGRIIFSDNDDSEQRLELISKIKDAIKARQDEGRNNNANKNTTATVPLTPLSSFDDEQTVHIDNKSLHRGELRNQLSFNPDRTRLLEEGSFEYDMDALTGVHLRVGELVHKVLNGNSVRFGDEEDGEQNFSYHGLNPRLVSQGRGNLDRTLEDDGDQEQTLDGAQVRLSAWMNDMANITNINVSDNFHPRDPSLMGDFSPNDRLSFLEDTFAVHRINVRLAALVSNGFEDLYDDGLMKFKQDRSSSFARPIHNRPGYHLVEDMNHSERLEEEETTFDLFFVDHNAEAFQVHPVHLFGDEDSEEQGTVTRTTQIGLHPVNPALTHTNYFRNLEDDDISEQQLKPTPTLVVHGLNPVLIAILEGAQNTIRNLEEDSEEPRSKTHIKDPNLVILTNTGTTRNLINPQYENDQEQDQEQGVNEFRNPWNNRPFGITHGLVNPSSNGLRTLDDEEQVLTPRPRHSNVKHFVKPI